MGKFAHEWKETARTATSKWATRVDVQLKTRFPIGGFTEEWGGNGGYGRKRLRSNAEDYLRYRMVLE